MKKTYNELCPGCEYNQLDIGLANLNGAPDQVVSFLRAHPDTKYIIQSTDSVFLGVPVALKAAGLNDIKIFGEGPTTAVQANIASGVQAGTMAFAFYEIMFAGSMPSPGRRRGQVAQLQPAELGPHEGQHPERQRVLPRSCRTRWISSKRSGGSSPNRRRSASRSHRRRGRASPTNYSSAARPVNQGVIVDDRANPPGPRRSPNRSPTCSTATPRPLTTKDCPTIRALFGRTTVRSATYRREGDAIRGADSIVAWIDSATRTSAWRHRQLTVYHIDIDGDEPGSPSRTTRRIGPPWNDPDTVIVVVARYQDSAPA